MPRPLMRSPLLEELPTPEQAAVSRSGLVLELSLKTITPVLGGGVKPFEPDQVDIVRAPSIRGHLRWWWRRLFHEPGEPAADLFRKEAALWGGVGKGVGGKGVGAAQSRVRILVLDAKGSPPRPAGYHELSQAGALKAAPTWELGSDFGYALFPLQRAEPERDKHGNASRMPTHDLRMDLEFKLRVEMKSKPGQGAETSAHQLLASLWCWIHLGGYGARTRRGFGALELVATNAVTGWLGSESWVALFTPNTAESFEKRLHNFILLAHGQDSSPWATEFLVSSLKENPRKAHQDGLAKLKNFRQGEEVGRDVGRGGHGSKTPGRSRWPEPNLLRLLRRPVTSPGFWDHNPPPFSASEIEAMGAPRAAFGLPIVAGFKKSNLASGGDTNANATIQPQGAERWASPLLLRPVRCNGGRYRALALILSESVGQDLEVLFKNAPGPARNISRRRWKGSAKTIETLLSHHNGDALAAFSAWLREPARGYSHA